jgi:outer membrane protein OmpA-like peptidoglycan-associated protein
MRALTSVSALLLVWSLAAPAHPADAPGTSDHPLVPRFEGSTIIGYESVAFDEFVLPLGKAVRAGEDAWKAESARRVEGKCTRLIYAAPQDASPLEILRNYQRALGPEGFSTVWECAGSECGPGDGGFLVRYVLYPPGGRLKTLGQVTEHAFSSPRDPRFAAMSRTAPEGSVLVSVFTAIEDFGHFAETAKRPLVLVDIVESAPLTERMVFVDAAAMAGDLSSQGRVALYGIQFDFDSDRVRPESDATLAEIATLMTQDPALRLFVVGHTDSTGGYQYNLDLSQRRAASVVAVLRSRYGVAEERLTPAGVGPLAPIAPNEAEDGRAQNRRVELVRR